MNKPKRYDRGALRMMHARAVHNTDIAARQEDLADTMLRLESGNWPEGSKQALYIDSVIDVNLARARAGFDSLSSDLVVGAIECGLIPEGDLAAELRLMLAFWEDPRREAEWRAHLAKGLTFVREHLAELEAADGKG